jgi:uncharacterized membrane protein YeaQ/YmgE (transglycosylase-associated protein family)
MPVLLLALIAIVVLVVIGVSVFSLALKLLWWALIGLFFGALGRLVIPGRQPIGVAATALGGIAASLLGGIIGRAAHLGTLLQFIIAVILAALFVMAYSRTRGARGSGLGHQ